MEYLVLWQEKKTDYENAARKIRTLKQITRRRKEQVQQFKQLDKKQKKQIKKLEELLEMQETLLTFFVNSNWLCVKISHCWYVKVN